MLNIVFGLIAVCLGIWGLVKYWWYIVDVLIAVFPLVLVFIGTIAVLAGIKNTGLRTTLRDGNCKRGAAEQRTRKKDV